jgi:hypothetical protein
MAKKHQVEKHEPRKDHDISPKKISTSGKAHDVPGKTHTSERAHVHAQEKPHIPEKPLEKSLEKSLEKPHRKSRAPKKSDDIESIPSMTEDQTKAYALFSESCKEVYEKFSKEKIDTRLIQLKSSPALVAVVRFMVMMHDLLRMYGVMQFNKHVSSELYKHLDEVQERTGQKLPLARVLLDGIKMTKMELLSGVKVHPLPDFEEPEYKTMTKKTPDPVEPDDEEFETQSTSGEEQDVPAEESPFGTSHVGPGGPDFDDSVVPQSGTPVDPPINPPASAEEEVPSEEPEP